MGRVKVFCFELPICCHDSRTPEGKFVLHNYLLLLCSHDSFQVCLCVAGIQREKHVVFVYADVCEGSLCMSYYADAYVSADRHPLARAK